MFENMTKEDLEKAKRWSRQVAFNRRQLMEELYHTCASRIISKKRLPKELKDLTVKIQDVVKDTPYPD